MGAGIALSIAERFPTVYKAYADRHKVKPLQLGEIIPVQVYKNVWIVNAMTQDFTSSSSTGRQVNYEAVAEAFERIVEWRKQEKLTTLPVIFPKIGAGLGGGSWLIVKAIIDNTLDQATVRRCYVL